MSVKKWRQPTSILRKGQNQPQKLNTVPSFHDFMRASWNLKYDLFELMNMTRDCLSHLSQENRFKNIAAGMFRASY